MGNQWSPIQQFTTATNKQGDWDQPGAALANLKLYPNPTVGTATISGIPLNSEAQIIVRDALGRNVLQRTAAGPNITFAVEAAGLYLVEVRTELGSEHLRLVVQ